MCCLNPDTIQVIATIVIPILGIIVSAFVANYVAIRAIKAEEDKGRALLENLCQRYFISLHNSFDQATNQIKNDALSKKQYVAELEAILTDLSVLSSNPFYIRFLRSSPLSSKCLVQARRELVEHAMRTDFALNLETAKGFASMYRESRKGISGRPLIEDLVEIIEKRSQ
jgi:hypothetical protein